MAKKSVAIVGYGVVGQAYGKMFPDAVIYDEPKGLVIDSGGREWGEKLADSVKTDGPARADARAEVNKCDVALVAVFTALKDDGTLDTSIVEEVVGWIECPLIIIKSALQPGTVDKLVAKTGKRIAVSVEYVGEGNYPVHYWKYPHQNDPRLHQMLVVGGEESVATEAAEVLWNKLSPDVSVHVVTALEAEVTKLIENAYGALKVTFINTLMSLTQKSNTNFIRVHQAWNSDPRTDSMHLRAVSFNRGWVSKCWDKDVPALVAYAHTVGAEDIAQLFQTIIDLNKEHLKLND
jgi:UDP-glucose 6-dehydrogenase